MEEEYKSHELEDVEEDIDHLEEKEEVDHLSRFMFGGTPLRRKNRHFHNHIQPNDNKSRKSDAWILGRKQREETLEKEIESDDDNNAIMNYINQIDIALLMKNVDMFMTSANEIKPLLKDLSPLLKKWIK